jgi:acyl-CoA hydrolase
MDEMKGKRVSDTNIDMAILMLPSDANPHGNVHGGVVMKRIDEAGGAVATRHSGGRVVTASVDRLDFLAPVFVGDILVIKASVNMVGGTSLEVGARVEAENPKTGEVRRAVSAYLTYVALDTDDKPKKVPPLILVTDEDRRRNREAKERRRVRLAGRCKCDPEE